MEGWISHFLTNDKSHNIMLIYKFCALQKSNILHSNNIQIQTPEQHGCLMFWGRTAAKLVPVTKCRKFYSTSSGYRKVPVFSYMEGKSSAINAACTDEYMKNKD